MISVKRCCLVVVELGRPGDEFAHDRRHVWLGLVGGFLYLLVAHLDRFVEAAQVCNHRYTESLDTAMMGHDDLRNGRHAYGITAKGAVHPIFGWSLKCGTLHTDIHTLLHLDALFPGNLVGLIDQQGIVGLVHVGKTRTGGEVLSAQRMLGEEVDMVGDDHQVADLELRVHAAGSIGDEERLDAQLVHDTHREGDLLHRVALIEVEAALHGHDVHPAELSEDELAAMSLDCRDGEVGYLLIRELVRVSYF